LVGRQLTQAVAKHPPQLQIQQVRVNILVTFGRMTAADVVEVLDGNDTTAVASEPQALTSGGGGDPRRQSIRPSNPVNMLNKT
jgi:hypothetical protein